MNSPDIPHFLQMPTQSLLNEFGAGRHKPGSGSAAALLGIVACKMMQTVIAVTRRNPKYAASFSQLDYVKAVLAESHEPFFIDAVQRDAVVFDSYYQAMLARRECSEPIEKRRLRDIAREKLMPATEVPLELAQHALDTAEKGITVYDLGASHVRGDSGVAVSAALSSCSGSLFIVYLNLLEFREGRWATTIRSSADAIAACYQSLQHEQFRRVSRIQAEGVDIPHPEFNLGFGTDRDDLTV